VTDNRELKTEDQELNFQFSIKGEQFSMKQAQNPPQHSQGSKILNSQFSILNLINYLCSQNRFLQ